MEFLKKLQELPDFKKKIIFWVTFFLITIICFYFWLRKAGYEIRKFGEEDLSSRIKLPSLSFPESAEKQAEIREELRALEEINSLLEKAENEELSPQEVEALEKELNKNGQGD